MIFETIDKRKTKARDGVTPNKINMAVTILEALQNANYNLSVNGSFGAMLANQQLKNAITLLEKGYSLNEEVEPLLEKYGTVEDVPDSELV